MRKKSILTCISNSHTFSRLTLAFSLATMYLLEWLQGLLLILTIALALHSSISRDFIFLLSIPSIFIQTILLLSYFILYPRISYNLLHTWSTLLSLSENHKNFNFFVSKRYWFFWKPVFIFLYFKQRLHTCSKRTALLHYFQVDASLRSPSLRQYSLCSSALAQIHPLASFTTSPEFPLVIATIWMILSNKNSHPLRL